MVENTLYYGDNLDVLRLHIKDESVDLIYLDPPFKSNQDYNVLFAEQNGTRAAAQIKAFKDTWRWDRVAERAYYEVYQAGGRVAEMMEAFRKFLGDNDMMAYLSMMAPRLVELRRVLKPTGSIYLHCDPTASHYLKLLMDAVFGPINFRNEIAWERTYSHNINARYYMRIHDIILFYVKDNGYLWNQHYDEYSEEQMKRYKRDKDGRLYKAENLTMTAAAEARNFEWRGARPPDNRGWAVSKEQLEKWWDEGRIIKRRDGVPRLDGLKVYLDEMPGKRVTDMWTDIRRIGNTSAERLGYPTQKPEALLERIIEVSSNEGDVVLDPFCGCGTVVAVAQRLNRKWTGIDITHLAITLIKNRLKDSFNIEAKCDYAVVGEPVDLSGARHLALEDKFQFQWWALGLVGARPFEKKKGADKGIDGRRNFIDGKRRDEKYMIFSVKSGHTGVKDMRDLGWVVEREKAAIGVLITLEEPTRDMRKEAAGGDFYHSDYQDTKHPRLQIITIEELLAGKKLDLPILAQRSATDLTFKKAPKAKSKVVNNGSLDFNK